MPELPEVEVTCRRIAPFLVGRRIDSIQTTPDSYFFLTPTKHLRRRLRGQVVTELERLGKYLVGQMEDGSRLFIDRRVSAARGDRAACPADCPTVL